MELFIDKVLPSILTSLCIALLTWLIAFIQGFLAERRLKKLEDRIKKLEELHKHDSAMMEQIIKETGLLEEKDLEWALMNQLISIYINEGLDKDIAEAKAKKQAKKMFSQVSEEKDEIKNNSK